MENLSDKCFSAADLVKRSAAQIWYFRFKAESRKVSQAEYDGEAYQKKVAESKGEVAQELRGMYKKGDIIVFFSNDLYKDGIFYEVKMVSDPQEEVPMWYLESSLLQVAFYKSMLMASSGIMNTPTFRVKEGYDAQTIKVNVHSEYHLLFGEEEYRVVVTHPKEILAYFIKKAKATLDYDEAKLYDYDNKFKHFQHLRKYFTFDRISKAHYRFTS